jgi:hypothetical protein
MNLVNRQSRKCLDVVAPCQDGTLEGNCDRVATGSLKKGSHLQLYRCNGEKSQEFEFMSNGRLRNQATDLCIDIRAPCKDHFRTPCERVPVTEIKHKAKLQLYTCHTDIGVLSNSYGNQKWNFNRSVLLNKDSGLCLTPLVDPKTQKLEDMTGLEVQTCSKDKSWQLFDFLESPHSRGETRHHRSRFAQKFEILSDGWFLSMGKPKESFLVLPALGVALVAALVIARSSRRHVSELMPVE